MPSTSVDTDHLVTASDLATRWSVSRATIYNLLPLGLPSLKVGRARRFRAADADEWLARQQETGK